MSIQQIDLLGMREVGVVACSHGLSQTYFDSTVYQDSELYPPKA